MILRIKRLFFLIPRDGYQFDQLFSCLFRWICRASVGKSQTGNTKDALTSGNDPVYEPDPAEKGLNKLT